MAQLGNLPIKKLFLCQDSREVHSVQAVPCQTDPHCARLPQPQNHLNICLTSSVGDTKTVQVYSPTIVGNKPDSVLPTEYPGGASCQQLKWLHFPSQDYQLLTLNCIISYLSFQPHPARGKLSTSWSLSGGHFWMTPGGKLGGQSGCWA